MTTSNKKNVLKPNLISSTIISREDEYIMLNKRELEMTDNFNTMMKIFAETCTILSSAGLGFILNLEPTNTKLYIFFLIVILVMLLLSIYAKYARYKIMNKILKLYQN